MTVEKLLGIHMQNSDLRKFRLGLRKLGTLTASAMERKFPRLKEIGIDLAIDESLMPWVLEVNTLPDAYLFRKLPDRSVFRRIYRYAAAYGRFRTKRKKG